MFSDIELTMFKIVIFYGLKLCFFLEQNSAFWEILDQKSFELQKLSFIIGDLVSFIK